MKPVYAIQCDKCLKILGVSWEEIECKKMCLKCAKKETNSQHPKVNCLSGGGGNDVKVLETTPVDILGTVSRNPSADVKDSKRVVN